MAGRLWRSSARHVDSRAGGQLLRLPADPADELPDLAGAFVEDDEESEVLVDEDPEDDLAEDLFLPAEPESDDVAESDDELEVEESDDASLACFCFAPLVSARESLR